MTVKDLIDELSEFPNEREVYIDDSERGEQLLYSVEGKQYCGYGPLIVVVRT